MHRQIGIKADEHRRKTNKGMQGSHQLRHAGHLNPQCHQNTDHGPGHDRAHQHGAEADRWFRHGGQHRDGHPDNAIPDSPLGAFLIG